MPAHHHDGPNSQRVTHNHNHGDGSHDHDSLKPFDRWAWTPVERREPYDEEPGDRERQAVIDEARQDQDAIDREYAAEAAEERYHWGPQTESDNKAWGGRGPSNSYEEWLAEGQEANPWAADDYVPDVSEGLPAEVGSALAGSIPPYPYMAGELWRSMAANEHDDHAGDPGEPTSNYEADSACYDVDAYMEAEQ